jgi:Heavy metal binding domain
MKKVIILFLALTLSGICLVITSCGSGTNTGADTEKQGKEYTSAYVCPMHCAGSGSETAGACPVCKMEYVKNENHKSDGHTHDGHSHEGHNH